MLDVNSDIALNLHMSKYLKKGVCGKFGGKFMGKLSLTSYDQSKCIGILVRSIVANDQLFIFDTQHESRAAKLFG